MTDTFKLDTSGAVRTQEVWAPDAFHLWQWSDLSPFTQGYIGALLLALDEQRMAHYQDRRRRSLPEAVPVRPAFSWLAPETLARIIADCERAPDRLRISGRAVDGREFWETRQSGGFSGVWSWSVLTVILGDDVKVRFA